MFYCRNGDNIVCVIRDAVNTTALERTRSHDEWMKKQAIPNKIITKIIEEIISLKVLTRKTP